MKIASTLLLFFSLFFTECITAQYGNGYGNGYGNNGYGSGRRMNSMQQDMPQSKPKETPVEETVAKIMERMEPTLELDALQSVAISNVLVESLNTQGILMKDESLSQEAKVEEYKSLSESTNKQINAYLTPEQQEKYTKYIEDSKHNKKSKSKKKDKN